MNEKIIWLNIFIITSVALVSGWNHFAELSEVFWKERSEPTKLNKTIPYCYHFTWMGVKFNKWTFKNIKNKTCNQYFKDKKTLCINPMVATYGGGEPDIGYILDNHAVDATCRLSQEQVCVKYTVTQNGFTSYQTRYCSHVNVEMEGPMRSGCIQEKRGSQLIEVCACRSEPGPDGICNSSLRFSPANPLVFLSTLTLCGTYLLHLRF